MRWIRALACRAVWTSLSGRPGPVHLNLPLPEPLVLTGPLPEGEPGGGGRADGRAWTVRSPPSRDAVESATALSQIITSAARGVVVLGRSERPATPAGSVSPLAQSAAAFSAVTGWPLLADPLSGSRGADGAIACYDALLRIPAFARAARPAAVLRVGDLPTSKPLREWLAGLDAIQVLVDPESAWEDPTQVCDLMLGEEPSDLLASLAARLSREMEPDVAWRGAWSDADQRATAAITSALGEQLSEPRLARELGSRLPADATLVVASSMPVRDVETFFAPRADPPRVLSNRGANGIDGTVATAYGVAAVAGGPVTLLVGDVALAHDVGSLVTATRSGIPLTIVLVDNGGGGIFDFLPVATQTDAFEAHVATPTTIDFAGVAQAFGLHHLEVATLEEFRAALEHGLTSDGTQLIHVRSSRSENVELHRKVWDAVGSALG